MARNTGRSGGEIGNAIKSMLVSLHSDKAVSEIEKLGVAMYKVGQDGEKSFRDTEQVLLDLMVTSDSTDKNIEKMLTSLSGGKFQYSKVASLIGDYNELIRTTELSIQSQEAGAHQAQMQMETLSRKLQGLKDDLAGLAVDAGNSGLTTWLKKVVDDVDALVKRLQTIPTGNWEIIGKAIEAGIAIKALTSVVAIVTNGYKEYLSVIDLATAAKVKQVAADVAEAGSKGAVAGATAEETISTGASAAAKTVETTTTVELTAAERALAIARGVATGGLSLLVGALVTGAISLALFNTETSEAAKKTQELAKQETNLTKQIDDKAAKTQSELSLMQSKTKFVNDLASAYPKLLQVQKQLDDQTKQGLNVAERVKANNEKIATTEHALSTMLGEEAMTRIKNSADVGAQIDVEVATMNKQKESLQENLKEERQAIIAHSIEVADQARARLTAIQQETQGLATEAEKQIEIYQQLGLARLADLKAKNEADKQTVVAADSDSMRIGMIGTGGQYGGVFANYNKNQAVQQETQSSNELNTALTAEEVNQQDAIKAAAAKIAALKAQQGTTIDDVDTNTGTVSDKESKKKGRKGRSGGTGETEYQEAKQEYETAREQAKYDQESQGKKFTANDDLYLYNYFLADAPKTDDKKHHETLDFNKGEYERKQKIVEEELELEQAKYDREEAMSKISADKKAQIEEEIAKKKADGTPLSADEEKVYFALEKVNTKLAESKEWYEQRKAAIEAETKLIENQLAAMKERSALEKKAMEIQHISEKKEITPDKALGSEDKPQKITREKQMAQQTYDTAETEATAEIGENAIDKAKQLQYYKDYCNAVTAEDRAKSEKLMEDNSTDAAKLRSTISTKLSAEKEYYTKIKQLALEQYQYENRYQIAALNAYKSGVEQAMNSILTKTKSFKEAMQSIFSSLWKAVAQQYSSDFAQKWTANLNKLVLGQNQANSKIKSSAQTLSTNLSSITDESLAKTLSQQNKEVSITQGIENKKINITQQADKLKETADTEASQKAVTNIGTELTAMLEMAAIMYALSALFGGGSSSSSSTTTRSSSSYYGSGATTSLPSYDVGSWELPEDTLAQVHKGETIFPADVSENLRTAAQNGGLFGSGNSQQFSVPKISHNPTYNITSMDGKGVGQVLQNNSREVTQGLAKVSRSLNIKNASKWGRP